MRLIVGLGNPGKKYDGTRHNIGFHIIDTLAAELNISMSKEKFKAVYGSERINGEQVFLMKPLTFMNLSGEAVGPFMNYFQIPLENIVVIYDDLDLAPGLIRLRNKGGHGGHNGMRSIIDHLGSKEFKRVRIGVGKPEDSRQVTKHVLGRFHADELNDINDASERAVKACSYWLKSPFEEVMSKFNKNV